MDKIFIEILVELERLNRSGKYTTFFDFSGHVNTVDIRIYKGKWTKKKKPFFYLPVIRLDAPAHRSSITGENFDPQLFLYYLAYLRNHRPTKNCPVLTYSEYGDK